MSKHIYVGKGGDDITGDGSAEKPFATLARAWRDLPAGGVVSVLPGRYQEGELWPDQS